MAAVIMLGAFAAHGLKARLDTYALGVFQTAVEYQAYHAFGLLIIGLIGLTVPSLSASTGFKVSGWLMLCGILFFSGSLYALALTGTKWLGAITPIGGTLFIIAWINLAVVLWRQL
ncbi:membrane protein [gamma proteobacterium HTCC5015]|nr:membrane protein [gamma proteobacterium HTCC5015]